MAIPHILPTTRPQESEKFTSTLRTARRMGDTLAL